MPYKSKAQESYFNANQKELEAQGVNVNHWNEVSKGLKLPERVTPKSTLQHKKKKILKKALSKIIKK
jgi:hypothetical protein